MALPNPAAYARILASHIASIKDHLEGAVGSTAPWHFRQSSGNFQVTLSTADGTTKVRVNDSAGVEVFSVDSDGNVTISGALAQGSFTFPTSASPTPTTEGQAIWDSDDNVLRVGDGATTKTLYPGQPAMSSAGSSLTEVATTSTSLVDLLTVSGLSIPVTSGIVITGNYSRTGGAAANVGALGFEINGTVISTPSTTTGIALTTNVNQAEDGTFWVYIAPRSTDYLNGWIGYYNSRVSGTGAAAVVGAFATPGTTNPIPNATVTSVTITAINNTGNVNIAAANVKVYEVL